MTSGISGSTAGVKWSLIQEWIEQVPGTAEALDSMLSTTEFY